MPSRGSSSSYDEGVLQLGGDVVVNCQFQYRNALADGIIGRNQSLEILAYGTAVRRPKQ
jgi:uncharacterized protein YbjQ (UPF0145 family)